VNLNKSLAKPALPKRTLSISKKPNGDKMVNQDNKNVDESEDVTNDVTDDVTKRRPLPPALVEINNTTVRQLPSLPPRKPPVSNPDDTSQDLDNNSDVSDGVENHRPLPPAPLSRNKETTNVVENIVTEKPQLPERTDISKALSNVDLPKLPIRSDAVDNTVVKRVLPPLPPRVDVEGVRKPPPLPPR